MKFKASLINQFFSDKDCSKLSPKQSNFFISQLLTPKFPYYLFLFVFSLIVSFHQSTLATVYSNCKPNNQLKDDLCQNLTHSPHLSDNIISNNTESTNYPPELMIESPNFQVIPQTLRLSNQLNSFETSVQSFDHHNYIVADQNIEIITTQINHSDQPENPSTNLAQDDSIDSNHSDPELGDLLLQEIEPKITPKQEKPFLYLIGNFGYLRNNNIFSGINPVDDNLFRTGVTLLALPSLSDQTSLLASVTGNFVSYSDQSSFDYDQLNLNVGIIHQFDENISGNFGWKNRQLFDGNNGYRFLNDHSLYLGINYEKPLTEALTFNAQTDLQTNFSQPDSRSQIINSFKIGLDYQITSQIKAGLNYQLALSNFTVQDRNDTYHELMGTLNYNISPNTSLEMFLGHSFGDSSNQFIDYDGLIFGLGFNVYLF